VEWGNRRALVDQLVERCVPRATAACADAQRSRGVVWIEPRVVVEVSYSEIMLGRLRDPVLRALVLPNTR
jgi:hypothetical protein